MENQLKVLFITLEYGEEITGGVGRVVNSMVSSIREKVNLHILLVQSKYGAIPWHRIRFHKIQKNQWVIKNYRRLWLTMLINLIKTEKYDLVHIFHAEKTISEVTRLIKKKFPQLKIIYSCHSITKYEYAIRNSLPDLLEYEDFIINRIDHIHFLNQSSLQYFRESYAPINRKIPYSIIPNGIDENSFQIMDEPFQQRMNRLLDKKNGKITVLCISRWSQGKGLEYLLNAIPQVTARYQNIQFVIAGRKSNSWEYQYQDYLREIDAKIGLLSDYVIPLGWLNDQERNTLFTFADILVMPSLLEYFPYSILEPMIAKIPIISSGLDCVREMLKENEECLLYESKDSSQLADKIVTLIQNPDLRLKLANNAYRKACECFQWDSIANMYLEMYQTELNNNENRTV